MFDIIYNPSKGKIGYPNSNYVLKNCPDFMVLCGKNGQGKTKFLSAIAQSNLKIIEPTQELNNYEYLDSHSVKLLKSNPIKIITEIEPDKSLKNNYENAAKNLFQFDWCKEYIPLHEEFIASNFDAISASTDEFNNFLLDSQFFRSKHKRRINNPNYVVALWLKKQISIKISNQGPNQEEQLNQLPPPHETVNRVFELFGFNVRATDPQESAPVSFRDFEVELKFTLLEDNSKILKIDELSGGERTVLGIVMSIYRADIDSSNYTQALLLDEVDAHLHPELQEKLISILQTEIQEKHNIKIIFSTHSATSVAACPENSLYWIENHQKPEKISKNALLHRLCLGASHFYFLNKSADIDIAVENSIDQYVFTHLLENIVSLENINFPNSFDFFHFAREGANRELVITNVERMQQKGLKCVYGIVDYDNRSVGSNYVFSLGDTERYAIENFIADPLIIIKLLVLKYHEDSAKQLLDLLLPQVNPEFDPKQIFDDSNSSVLQDVIHKFENSLITTNEPIIDVEYLNGNIYGVNQKYLHTKGHDLIKLILDTHPQLRSLLPNDNKSEMQFAKLFIEITRSDPGLIPNSIYKTLLSISDAYNN